MAIPASITDVLAVPHTEDGQFSHSAAIGGLIDVFGWPIVRDAMLEILEQDRPREEYQVAANVIWDAVCDGRDLPADRTIALLYHRFDPQGDNEDNLIWSITSKLRKLDYLSDYRPLDDPNVQCELKIIREAHPT